jgi:hypothetical protein
VWDAELPEEGSEEFLVRQLGVEMEKLLTHAPALPSPRSANRRWGEPLFLNPLVAMTCVYFCTAPRCFGTFPNV